MASELNPQDPKVYQSGGLLAVDPNPGREEGGQGFQPQEEYNIFVELRTFRRNRQKIIKEKGGDTTSNTPNEGEETIINFIDGSNVGGERNLTTHYTELRTQFEDEQQDLETLGITSIDIEFNTSYTPLITINFTDVRGRLFEQGNQSKYNIFFNLPYPLFSLTVKGYYGPPITYCLHLTKFKSKFNSDTGNFEITTNFVGYTHAFLSDMLMGYVRAIGETECGQDKLESKSLSFEVSIKDDESSFQRTDSKTPITINEFLNRTQKLNKFVNDFKKDDEQVQQYIKANNIIDRLSEIKESIEIFRNEITGLNDNDDTSVITFSENLKGVIIIPKKHNSIEFEENEDGELLIASSNGESKINIEEKYNRIISKVKNVNEQIDSKDYKVPLDDTVYDIDDDTIERIKENSFIFEKQYINEAITSEYGEGNDDKRIVMIDTKALYDSVDQVQNTLEQDSKDALDVISKRVQSSIQTRQALGFKPTIANIIEIFSKNVEALMQCIHDASETAQSNINGEDLPKSKFPGGNENRAEKSGRFAKGGGDRELDTEEEFYPFPDFRVKRYDEEAGEKVFEHAWIGNEFPEIAEVYLVNSLIDGLLETKKSDKSRARNQRGDELGWFPIHPYDIVLNDNNPYSFNFGEGGSAEDQLVKLINDRAALYLHGGYSLSPLSRDEVKLMAKLEANNLFNGVDSNRLKNIIAGKEGDINLIDEGNTNEYVKSPVLDVRNIRTFKEFDVERGGANNLVVLDNLKLGKDSDSFKDFVDDITIYTRSEFKSETAFRLPNVRSELNTTISKLGNFLGEAEDNPLGYRDIADEEAEYYQFNDDGDSQGEPRGYDKNQFFKTKFSGKKAFTDFTKVVPDLDLENVDTIPTFYVFYENKGHEDLVRIPFTSDKRVTDYEDIVSEEGVAIERRSGGSLKNYNPWTSDMQGKVLFDYRSNIPKDRPEGEEDGLGKLSGEAVKNLSTANFNTSEVKLPFLGFNFKSLSNERFFNIFGTHLYYNQNNASEPDRAKAFLFLSSIPFRGFSFAFESDVDANGERRGGLGEFVFGDRVLENLFNVRSSFVSVPYSWLAYLGSLIWRSEKTEDPIKFNKEAPNGKTYTTFPNPRVVFRSDDDDFNVDYYIQQISDDGKDIILGNHYGSEVNLGGSGDYDIDYTDLSNFTMDYINALPDNIKSRLKNIFTSWVDNGSWKDIRDQFEIFDRDISFDEIVDFWRSIIVSDNNLYQRDVDIINGNSGNHPNVNFENIKNNYSLVGTMSEVINDNKNIDDFENELTNLDSSQSPVNFFLEFSDNGSRSIIDFLFQERIVANPSPHTFRIFKNDTINKYSSTDDNPLNSIFLRPNSDFFDDIYNSEGVIYNSSYGSREEINELYFDAFINELNTILGQDQNDGGQEDQVLKKEIFNTIDNDDIKLSVYQDIKNIYDKWVAGIGDEDENSIDCGPFIGSLRNEEDGRGLFDSFRFLDRSFNSMKDKMLINPLTITNFLTENFNKSFYTFLSRILSDNNIDFIPLPNFIDFTEPEHLKKVFKPYQYTSSEEFDSEIRRGPTFVCMYMGERSKSLDLGNESDYENDGFDIRLIENEGSDGEADVVLDDSDVPQDYTTENTESKTPIFFVNFADQNQSIFQNLNLDQSEFTETNESLIVQERISQRGSPTSQNMQGQNLYDVYQKRAYHCDIDALGTAFIQPLMQFQLNNVPMFHGVYMIIKVSHNIKPNHMTTNFQGVRVGRIKTPFVEDETVFMNLIGSLSDIDLEDDVQLNQDLLESPFRIGGEEGEDRETVASRDDIDEDAVGDVGNDTLTDEMRAMLDVIAFSEGTLGVSDNGYDILVGYKQIQDYNRENYQLGHRRWSVFIESIGNRSTASGRYQFKYDSWVDESSDLFPDSVSISEKGSNDRSSKGKLSNLKFKAANQDLVATNRLRKRLKGSLGNSFTNDDGVKFDSPPYSEKIDPDSEQNRLGDEYDDGFENFKDLVERLSFEWASFPNFTNNSSGESVYGQGAKDIDSMYDIFNKALKSYRG